MNDETPKTRWWKRLLHRPGWLIALAVCLLLSAVLVPFGWRYYRTRQLVAGIEAHGGRVGFNQGGPQWLRDVVGDEWMAPFEVPTNILSPGFCESLRGGKPATISNARENADFFVDVVAIDDIHGIRILAMHDEEMNDHLLEQLSQFEQLEILSLSGPNCDDAALAYVSKVPRLRNLTLFETSVTDEGLRHLYALNNLRILELAYTKVTAGGISELQRHLPHLSITNH